jgi:hypothetical protein
MIGNSARIVPVPEGPFKFKLLRELSPATRPTRDTVVRAVAALKNDYGVHNWKISPDPEVIANQVDFEAAVFAQVYRLLAVEYVKTHWPDKLADLKFIVDHDPSNSKHASSLRREFPESHFLHIIRDGRAIAASVFPLDWGPNDIFGAVIFWLTNLGFGFAAESLYASKAFRIKYEDILQDPPRSVAALCEHLQLDFEHGMLLPEGLIVPDYTRRQHVLIGKSLNRSQIDKWKKSLSKEEVSIFEKETYEMLAMLGYTLVGDRISGGIGIKIKHRVNGAIRNYLNLIRKKNRERAAKA